MTAQSPLCDRCDLGDEDTEQQAPQDVGRPVIGQVHTREHHEGHHGDRKPLRDPGDASKEGDPGDVTAGERTDEGDVREWHQLDAPRQLVGRERLWHERLDDDLDRSDHDDQERHPGIDLAATEAGPRETERDPAGDLGLPEDADSGGEDVEPRCVHGLGDIDHGAIELTQRTDRDQGAQSDEGCRKQRDADQR